MEQLSPQLLERLRLLAAREVLHQVATTEIVGFANDALNQGVYHDLLLAIVDAHPSTRAEVLRPFIHYCEKSGIHISSRDDARLVLFAHYVQRMADARLDPIKEFCAFLNEVQTEGALRLKSDLPTYAEEIGILIFTDMLYSYESEYPRLSANDFEKAARSNANAVQMRDAARKILTMDNHNLAEVALQRSSFPQTS
jgi:hypothetical protein